MGCGQRGPAHSVRPVPRPTFALLLAALFGTAAQLLFYGERPGLNAGLAIVLFLTIAWRLRRSPMPPADLWMPLLAVAFATSVAVRTDAAVVAFDLLAVATLSLATTASLRGVSVTRLPVAGLVLEAAGTAMDVFWRAVPVLERGSAPLARSAPRLARLGPSVAGIALAVPLLVVFAALFRSADPVFARAWDAVLDVSRWWAWLGEAPARILFGAVVAWLAAGALADRGGLRGTDLRGRLDVEIATAFLASLTVLFAAFVSVQIAYLFGGADTIAAASITYSEYARRGFFELLFVAGLIAVTLFVTEIAIAAASRTYMACALVLIALTFVIVASALYRLGLYQFAYGWSELRLYGAAAILAVTAALAILVRSILMRRTAYAVQPIVFAAFAIALGVNALGPSGFVARANVSRFLEAGGPEKVRLDARYLVSLGPGAVPDLVALRERLPEAERRCLDLQLSLRYGREDPPTTWQSWNLDRERARAALAPLRADVFPRIEAGACSAASP